MIISVNWLKKFTNITGSVEELAELIGARLVEIEGIQNLGEKYEGVVVAKVITSTSLEGSDHLSIVHIDDGGVVKDVERNEAGLVQVVCGAPNVKEGMLVAWLPPKTVVPETHGTAEPFLLSSKPLRGVVSNGMLASARELDLYDDHAGILEIDKEAAPGASFAELYELNDYLLDIENKSLTHRPDAFGVIGFAREVAGIQGHSFETPQWLEVLESAVAIDGKELEAPSIKIEDTTLSDRFQAIVLSGSNEAATSPVQLQTYLARSGVRPVSASVDVSNYLMLLTGQPSHAYDYDKLKAVAGDDFTVRVRKAREGERLTLLDGKDTLLDPSDIVIAAGNTAIGLAGIMGGQNTLVDSSTKNILFEAATFNLYHMRASQMRHGIFSEAVTRFTKGIPAALSTPVINEAARMLQEYTGAKVSSAVAEDYPAKEPDVIVDISSAQVNDVLGTHFAAEDIADLLRNVGFKVEFDNLVAHITAPYWRKDIHIAEDIIEEVGRLAGYDTINFALPKREFVAVRPGQFDVFRKVLRQRLVRAGANEVLTYSFVHGDVLKKAGQATDNSYRIVNSISPDLQYYRQTLTPSVLSQVFPNVKAGYESFSLFELNKVHQKADGLTREHVPVERESLALVVADAKKEGAAYYNAKQILSYLVSSLGVEVSYQPLTEEADAAIRAPFESKRSAVVVHQTTGNVLGVIGEYKKATQKALKLPAHTAGFELTLQEVFNAYETVGPQYQPLSRYPGTERDICFQVTSDTSYGAVYSSAWNFLKTTNFIVSCEPVDIYQPPEGGTKNITLRVKLASYQKTLTGEEVSEVVNNVVNSVIQVTGGKVV